jgi:hypothetical protein
MRSSNFMMLRAGMQLTQLTHYHSRPIRPRAPSERAESGAFGEMTPRANLLSATTGISRRRSTSRVLIRKSGAAAAAEGIALSAVKRMNRPTTSAAEGTRGVIVRLRRWARRSRRVVLVTSRASNACCGISALNDSLRYSSVWDISDVTRSRRASSATTSHLTIRGDLASRVIASVIHRSDAPELARAPSTQACKRWSAELSTQVSELPSRTGSARCQIPSQVA